MEEKQKKKKQRIKRLILPIIILLLIHIILNIIKIPIEVEKEIETTFKIENAPEVQEEFFERQCFKKEFEWNYRWEGYNEAERGYISPQFRLFNEEDRRGTYYIQFGFFDNSIYHFNLYRDKPYREVIDELPWDASGMHSENISVVVGPYEDRLITSYTTKKNVDASYWAYALVTEPTYNKCETVSTKINKTTQREVTQETDTNIFRTETEYISAWDYLMQTLFS